MSAIKKIAQFLLIGFICSVSAQEMVLPATISNSYFEKDRLYLFTNEYSYTVELKNYKTSPLTYFTNTEYDLKDFTSIRVKGIFYFIENVGGKVLKLQQNKLERIDKSFTHKMQVWSSIFQYQGTIYRYGGYGFFSERPFILKFDLQTKEWESINITSPLQPEGRAENAFLMQGDKLYVVGGTVTDPLDRKVQNQLNDYWEFSFKEMCWTQKGEHELFSEFSHKNFQIDGEIYAITTDQIYTLDPEKNMLKTYKLNNSNVKLNAIYKIGNYNNRIYFVRTNNNDENVLTSVAKTDFYGELVASEVLHFNKGTFLIELLTVLMALILIFFVGLKFRKYNTTLLIKSKEIKYKNTSCSITEQENMLLKEFVKNQNKLENNTIQLLTEQPQYDHSHNVRLKNALIQSLNTKLKFVFNSDEAYIFEDKSAFDKRYKCYFLKINKVKIVD